MNSTILRRDHLLECLSTLRAVLSLNSSLSALLTRSISHREHITVLIRSHLETVANAWLLETKMPKERRKFVKVRGMCYVRLEMLCDHELSDSRATALCNVGWFNGGGSGDSEG